jgi:hypothetical protein
VSDDVIRPRCYDCLTEDVSVKLIDEMGFEHWFCAEDWAGWQEVNDKVLALMRDGIEALR